jgi:hypothetical protein
MEMCMVGLALRGHSGSRSEEELVMLRLHESATRPARRARTRDLPAATRARCLKMLNTLSS